VGAAGGGLPGVFASVVGKTIGELIGQKK